jgi:RHS repeat-associated protein
MKLTYIKQAGEPKGDGGDQYTGLDRFGRVVDQRWPQGSSELERVDYGFTAASNRQWRQNLVAAGGQDEYYNYDGLYQVAELNRGTLNSGKTAISGTPSWTEDFTYDPIGNWDAYLTKVSGVTDLDQTRTHNTANQTTEIDESTDNVAHDLAGNMVKTPQVNDWESTFDLKWDAWNRLVEVADGETVVAEYRYDGITRRIRKETDDTRHYYYSDRWQILEERLDSETTADRQFIWGQRYVDDLVLRDRDVDNDGSMDERLYVLSDYFNPTAIADEDGVVVERYGYNAFGLSRVMDADFEPRSASDFDWETRYGAYRWDGETGFYQVRFRYLHPTLGRWPNRDPIEELGGNSLYNFVRNSPVNQVDVFGLLVTGAFDINTGNLVVTDVDTGETIVLCGESGGKPYGDPLPTGQYELLDHPDADKFRLDAVDSTPRNDIHEPTGRDEFRLHKPGNTIGCIAAKLECRDCWDKVRDMIRKTKTENVLVKSKRRRPLPPIQETIKKFGDFTVLDSSKGARPDEKFKKCECNCKTGKK